MRTRGAKAWTPAEMVDLRERWKAGEDDETISAAMGRSPHAIGIKRQREGLVVRRIKSSKRLQDYASESLRGELRRRDAVEPAPSLTRAHRRLANVTEQAEQQRIQAHRRTVSLADELGQQRALARLRNSRLTAELEAARAEIEMLRASPTDGLTLGDLVQVLGDRGYNVTVSPRVKRSRRAG